MSRREALLTVATVAAVFSFLYMSAFGYQIMRAAPKAVPPAPTRPTLTVSQQGRLAAVLDAARSFKQCVNPELAKRSCVEQFQSLSRLLAETDNPLHEFHKTDFFDTFVNGDWLILRRAKCSEEDVADHYIAWSAWSRSKEPETEAQRIYGQVGAYHAFDTEGRRIVDACLMVIQLPLNDIGRIFISLLDNSKGHLIWKLDQKW